MSKFIILVLGIIMFCASAGYWVIEGGYLPLCMAFGGLAVIAGEGFKIALFKELEADRLDREEAELKNDLTR